ncbi:2-succinyl-5-enolpyruvyl-6-hydroxy-3-cyclohexene-1-carboxylate synthase [Spirochaetia bacterium]|nr:2-succinyl-5-enolpyruvyl-6-hydroxy-3-cyclohexene-1-carboxylate synthase [Spirochaetia bacterium]
MYTTSKSVQIIVSLLKQHGINQVVISPGGTNVPIVQGIQDDPFFTCYSVVDERSAMYFAIGLYFETGKPVATSCTSAQATRNYLPGLTEAFYKHVPILAITASKHPKYWGQEYMQAPVQTSLSVDSVKQTFSLPYVDSKIDELHCVRMVNEAILEITHRVPGPVQLNVPILDSVIEVFDVPELPSVRSIKRYMVWDEWNDADLTGKKIMIVAGEHRPYSDNQIAAIDGFVESYNTFVYVNHLSNYHGKYAVSANLAMSCLSQNDFEKSYKPDILITIGGQIGDYYIFGKLQSGNHTDFEHWRVAEDGNIVDTYDKLTKVFECPFELFFTRLTGNRQVEHAYYESWEKLQGSMAIPEELPFSNPYLAQQLHASIPKNSCLNLAIKNSLRTWCYFPLDSSIICNSNVAAFGIDGCMSVFLGQSVATDKLCFLVIGDLAFFYDMNSLGIRHRKKNIRILVVNNDGGAEFKLNSHPYVADTFIAAAGHNGTVKGWAESTGFKYISAVNKEEFLQHKGEFVFESEQSIVFEVFTTPESEAAALKTIHEKSSRSIKDVLKNKVRSVIGDEGVKVLKDIFLGK